MLPLTLVDFTLFFFSHTVKWRDITLKTIVIYNVNLLLLLKDGHVLRLFVCGYI